MTSPIATYSFLPWLRRGVANNITAADHDAGVSLRAQIGVDLELTGEGGDAGRLSEAVHKDVRLFGPGDIVGIDPRAIIKTEPHNWITNFEPNYLPYIDFYDEDFPWRYTPAAPDGTRTRLRPWIMLVVLKEGEFEEGANIQGKPLPFIKVADPSLFPPADQLWAWAHVHVNESLAADDAEIVSSDMGAVLPRLQAVLDRNPDLSYARILCPRQLEADSPYHAFLVPVFESGRLAGLGLDPAGTPYATCSAWDATASRQDPQSYPYYHRWYFHTGTLGDFEYLVRLLQPKPVDKRVGRRDIDVLHPGANLPAIDDPDLGGVLKLGGALRVPAADLRPDEVAEIERFENWARPYPHPFQQALATFMNLADDYSVKTTRQAHDDAGISDEPPADGEPAPDPDPLITPPLYGRWHALVQRLLKQRDGTDASPNDNWVHELNLDPRFRIAAGFGTKVVQDHQEEYMNAAWEQLGDVLEASRRIRLAQLAREVSWIWHERHLLPLTTITPEKALLFTSAVHNRVIAGNATVHHQLATSVLTPAPLSAPMRRITRPRGRLMRSLPFDATVKPTNLLARINAREVSAAPPKQVPAGAATLNNVWRAMLPADLPARLAEGLRRFGWIRYFPLIVIVLIILLVWMGGFGLSGWALAAVLVAALVFVYRKLTSWVRQVQRADALREENQTPQAVDRMPRSPDFVISQPGSGFTPRSGNTDSPEAVRFKTALRDQARLRLASLRAAIRPPKQRVDLPALAGRMFQALNPNLTIPRRTWQSISLPARVTAEIGERFIEPMAYPVFDMPMYKPLSEISSELLVPNVNLIDANSITILETNQKFVESYMVGLNHELAREALWRAFPTDQRGSYFRQFWDVSGYFDAEGLDAETLKERLRDIPPLHRWSRFSVLGSHDNRELSGTAGEEVVLAIRGELLKKYPTAVIYAHKAEWQRNADGTIDNTRERRLVDLDAAESDRPPRTKIKTPLYEAKIEPDIYFFGFDLTVEEARGGTGEHGTDPPGWFFVIKERPGEPHFGLDIDRSGDLNVWNDLAWSDVLPAAPSPPVSFIHIDRSFSLTTPASGADAEAEDRRRQYMEDQRVRWDTNTNSADLAYILYQVPVLVAVHAAEMLTR